LEAQNRKLAADLDLLRGKWGKDTFNIKMMYEGELAEARKLINDTARQRDDLEKQIHRMQDELSEYRKRYEDALRARDLDSNKIDTMLIELAQIEADINALRRRITELEEEVMRIKKDNQSLLGELQRTRTDVDQETLNRIDYQNQVQTLLEEIDFIRRVHEQEIRELQSLAARDTTPENREFFKNELASAIRDIRAEYDQVSSTG
uniref:IF rod domain-containing protein n=1 Tax=Gongylonema pulchrum TaxID=637853 RepID=A0A183EIW6_9BILA